MNSFIASMVDFFSCIESFSFLVIVVVAVPVSGIGTANFLLLRNFEDFVTVDDIFNNSIFRDEVSLGEWVEFNFMNSKLGYNCHGMFILFYSPFRNELYRIVSSSVFSHFERLQIEL